VAPLKSPLRPLSCLSRSTAAEAAKGRIKYMVTFMLANSKSEIKTLETRNEALSVAYISMSSTTYTHILLAEYLSGLRFIIVLERPY
jgi:hypothetical protein